MIKRSYLNQMTYDISNEEKNQARQLLTYVDYTTKLLDDTKEFLDTIKVPFENNKEMESKEILSQRVHLREFRDKVLKKFADFKLNAFYSINVLTKFSSDPQIAGMMKAFVSTVSDCEKSFEKLETLFNNMESATFVKDIIDLCKLLQAKLGDLENILNDRIRNYVSSNILGETWVSKMYKDLKISEPSKKPKTLDLINRRPNVYKNR
jgi:hypothetical protein